ncbi:toxin VasX [Alkalimarinus coralli]|uniref:toxin VasX n=1 Tax=Alkalimarinus coralli TaxID=2935863 RepID=UPI00202AEDB3|nr:toxin VasX [Alkalimarinus coralli]
MSESIPVPHVKKIAAHVNLNVMNTLVLEQPVRYHAIYPIGYALKSAQCADPALELKALPSQQSAIQQYTRSISDRTLVNAPLLPGWLYVFREGVLWKEFQVRADSETENTQTSLYEVDLEYEQTKDQRDAGGEACHYFLLPENAECEIAVSNIQWPWVLINQFGGLRNTPHPQEVDWPYLLPKHQLCRVDDDTRLYQWTATKAASRRKARFQSVSANNTSPHQSDEGISQAQLKAGFVPNILNVHAFSAVEPLTPAISPSVSQACVINVLDAEGFSRVLSYRYHCAWALLDDAQKLIATPYEESDELYKEFPYSSYYESALLAHQLYFSEEMGDAETLWQRDNLQLKNRNKLKLNDIQRALGVDLRRTIRELITQTGNDLADFLQGRYSTHGQDWLENLVAQLEDSWAYSEMPSNEQEDENKRLPYRHTRWETLSNLLLKLADHPASTCQYIDGTPAIRKEVSEGKTKDPGFQVVNAIIEGRHPLSALTLNQPQDIVFTYQRILQQLDEEYDDAKEDDPKLLSEQLRQLHRLTAKGVRKEDNLLEPAILNVSLATVQWVFAVAGQLFVGSNTLSVENLGNANSNGTIDAIRKLLNWVTDAHLNYVTFDEFIETQNNQPDGHVKKQKIIAHILSDMEKFKTEVSETDTPISPERYARNIQQDADEKTQHLTNKNQQYRNGYKRLIGPDAIDERITQLNAHVNRDRKIITDRNKMIRQLMGQQEKYCRSQIKNCQVPPDIDRHTVIVKLEREIKHHAKARTAAVERRSHAKLQIADFKELKVSLEKSRKQKKSAQQDSRELLKEVDSSHPLHDLKATDNKYFRDVKRVENEAALEIKRYQQQYQSNQDYKRQRQQQGIEVIETNTPEGRQLKAFLAQQREKLAGKLDQPITRIYTTEANFDEMRIEHGHKPNTIVFTPAQSTSMNAVQQGSYITVGAGGEHIYRGSEAQTVKSRQQGTVTVASMMVGLDMLNTFQLLSHWKSSDKKLEQGRNIVDALGALTGTSASIGELWKSLYESRQLNNQANTTSVLARRVNDSRFFNVGVLKVLPVTAAISGILVSGYDLAVANSKGDDVAKAHMAMVVSCTTMLAVAIWQSVAFLGPLGIAMAGASVILQNYVFKEDNMLDTWLEKGPFSEEKNAQHPRFRSIPWAQYQPHSEVSEGLKQRMGVERHSVWLGGSAIGKPTELKDAEGRYRKILSLSLPPYGISLILDQNYQLLGYKRLYANLPLDSVIFDDLTGDISVNDNGYKRLLGRIGKQLGESSWRIVDALVDNLPSMMAANNASNTRVRFEDDWGDEDKFTEPMKRYPAASLELLLNGLYPLNAEFELMPVEKKLVGRNRGRAGIDLYEMKGNRAKVTVDLPYFIEGESVLTIEIRVARDSEEEDKNDLPAIVYNDEKTIRKTNIASLPPYIGDKSSGSFKLNAESGLQYIQIIDFDKFSFDNTKNIHIGKEIELECWVKLGVNKFNKNDTKSHVAMPWRGADVWLSKSPSILSVQKSWLTIRAADTLRG